MLEEVTAGRLVEDLGAAPAPHPEALTRNELLVLAALSRAPRGLVSARAVAVVAGLSPTTAGRMLGRLVGHGLAHRRREPRLLRGRSTWLDVWYATLDAPAMERLLPYLHDVVLPSPPSPRLGDRLPDQLWHLVWNADPADVNPAQHASYLAHRAITSGDPEALAWAVTNLPPDAFATAVRMRGVPDEALAWLRANATEQVDAHA